MTRGDGVRERRATLIMDRIHGCTGRKQRRDDGVVAVFHRQLRAVGNRLALRSPPAPPGALSATNATTTTPWPPLVTIVNAVQYGMKWRAPPLHSGGALSAMASISQTRMALPKLRQQGSDLFPTVRINSTVLKLTSCMIFP